MSVKADSGLRIAMISYYLPSDSKMGVGYQVHALANALVDRGHAVDVFSASASVEGARYGHHLVSPTGRLRTFKFALELRHEDFTGYDVLHAHGDDYWLPRRRTPAHIRTLHGSCFAEALHIRGARERLRMSLLGFSELLASLVADKSVLVSPGTRRWTPWVSTVIPNGVLVPDTLTPEARANHPVVLFVGTWGGRKRGKLLADAFVRHVLPALPAAELWMVSRDVPVEVHQQVKGLGRVSAEELATLYARAWVFCLPSSYEGFGIPYAEAMAAGIPVVATRNPGSVYITERGRMGLLTSVGDLGPALLRLLTNDVARDEYGALGRARAKQFELAEVAASYERLYDEVVRSRSGRL